MGIETDARDQMLGVNSSIWTRTKFQVDEPSALESLALRLKYNDGLIAYLNGTEVARQNAPPATAWNASASAARPLSGPVCGCRFQRHPC